MKRNRDPCKNPVIDVAIGWRINSSERELGGNMEIDVQVKEESDILTDTNVSLIFPSPLLDFSFQFRFRPTEYVLNLLLGSRVAILTKTGPNEALNETILYRQ